MRSIEARGRPRRAAAARRRGGAGRRSSGSPRCSAPPLLPRLLVGCLCLIVINTLLYGFVTWLPTFFVKQGLTIATSFGYALLMALGAPVGSRHRRAHRRPLGPQADDHRRLGGGHPVRRSSIRWSAIRSCCRSSALALTIPIYVLVALLFGIYIPELFPTEVRLRASGLCNTFGRGATDRHALPRGVRCSTPTASPGVLGLMIGLLALQIVAVAVFGVEPRRQSLESLEPALAAARARGRGASGAEQARPDVTGRHRRRDERARVFPSSARGEGEDAEPTGEGYR